MPHCQRARLSVQLGLHMSFVDELAVESGRALAKMLQDTDQERCQREGAWDEYVAQAHQVHTPGPTQMPW